MNENKDIQLRVRLNPSQSQRLDEMCDKYSVSKSTATRFILDQFFDKYGD